MFRSSNAASSRSSSRALLCLQEALLHLGRAVGIEPPVAKPGDLGIERSHLPLELGDAHLGIGLGRLHNLAQQLKDRQEPRLGTDELALAEALDPLDDLLGGGRQIVLRLAARGRTRTKRPVPSEPGNRLLYLVGGTGFEPVTPSV